MARVLLSCRNLLVYLNADLQHTLMAIFHDALNPRGTLFLGTGETVSEVETLFTPLDRTWKLFRRHDDLPDADHPTLGVGMPVTGRGEILHIPGRTDNYLELALGDAASNLNILLMAVNRGALMLVAQPVSWWR